MHMKVPACLNRLYVDLGILPYLVLNTKMKISSIPGSLIGKYDIAIVKLSKQ